MQQESKKKENRKIKLKKERKLKLYSFTIFLFILTMGIFGVNDKVKAAEYYVAPKSTAEANMADEGAEAWNNAQNIDRPCSVQTAMQRAVAGDIVYFLDGVYNGLTQRDPIGAYEEPALFAHNNGTLLNPIYFRALNRRRAILKGKYEDACYCFLFNKDMVLFVKSFL